MKTPAVLVGQAIGDALGVPFEKPKDEIHELLADWDGTFRPGTYHKLPAGHWTDDTEMAVALTESMIESGGYNPERAAANYLAWSQNTPHGMGSTTRKAMDALSRGVSWDKSGVEFGPNDGARVGNGTAMRIAPLAVVYATSPKLETFTKMDASITHKHNEANVASIAVVNAIARVLDGRDDLLDASAHLFEYESAMRIPQPSATRSALMLATKLANSNVSTDDAMKQLGRRGNATQTVASAWYFALKHGYDFRLGVTEAVRAGGDTDTRAAIVGAILGAQLGLEGIPESYLIGLNEVEKLRTLDNELVRLRESVRLAEIQHTT